MDRYHGLCASNLPWNGHTLLAVREHATGPRGSRRVLDLIIGPHDVRRFKQMFPRKGHIVNTKDIILLHLHSCHVNNLQFKNIDVLHY